VGVRTNHRGEPVYLYRLNTSAADARRLLLVYLARINELADHPEFYHLLTNSCTINIVRYANAAGRSGGFELRHLLNRLVDGYLYDSGRIDTTLPFDELRRRSLINEDAQAADSAPDFSQQTRMIEVGGWDEGAGTSVRRDGRITFRTGFQSRRTINVSWVRKPLRLQSRHDSLQEMLGRLPQITQTMPTNAQGTSTQSRATMSLQVSVSRRITTAQKKTQSSRSGPDMLTIRSELCRLAAAIQRFKLVHVVLRLL
jgi:hypothetical protein